MKSLVLSTMALALAFTFNAGAQTTAAKPAPTLRSILLDQLRSTHDKSDWFVCANVAVANLTPEQANWKDGKGNHSVGQLTYHLVFWNQRTLARLKGEPQSKFSGNNEETFDTFDAKRWNDTVRQFDEVMNELPHRVVPPLGVE